MNQPLTVTFWGVRGTIPTPDMRMMRYGGNTSCVEVRCGDLVIALDAGTGIRGLSDQADVQRLHVLLSHTHIDHIMGLICMKKLFNPAFEVDFWSGHLIPELLLHEALGHLISPPIFPVTLDAFPAIMNFHDFTAGRELRHSDFSERGITISTLPLHHPDNATAYRIEYGGRSICYVTDVEHVRGGLDASLIDFIRGADLFIYDSTYDDREFEQYHGWGHSTWQEAMRLGAAAGVDRVVLFHHDPSATDAILDARAEEIATHYTQSATIAREGWVWKGND
jgi:phosphoribosyl 1,2-cyclic phosphodiesterase